MSETQKVALVVGAGVATGGAVARRFAKEGFIACMARRKGDRLDVLVDQIEKDGGRAVGYSCDATDEAQMVALIEEIESTVGPIEVACYNAAVGVAHSILDFPTEDYERVWRINTLGAFLMGREVALSCLPGQPRHFAVRLTWRPLLVPNTRCVPSLKVWRGNSFRKTSMLRTSLLTVRLIRH
jgi:NAD(P)-dependent dehydrogenase (short-subunit alcohol dehydrogenase family)